MNKNDGPENTAELTPVRANRVDEVDDQIRGLLRRLSVFFREPVPTGSFSLSYLAEGAANVVWLIHFQNSNLDQHDSSVVLRMRKDVPSTLPMVQFKRDFEARIAPLFSFDPSLLLPVELVQLCPQVIDRLNRQLRQLEGAEGRSALRTGTYHPDFADEQYAMVMPNLGHGPGVIVEFKPKWLTQSPSAPRNAQRCRTCAMNSMRRSKGGSGRGDSGFCPFDLLSRKDAILFGALRQIWRDEDTLSSFADTFRSRVQPALRQLQKLQLRHNEVGLEDFQQPQEKDFAVAMALRDCSMVLKVVQSGSGSASQIPTVKLLDLDLKDSGGGKLEKWARMESELIEEVMLDIEYLISLFLENWIVNSLYLGSNTLD
ncbi:Inositol-pentakisphosphate 2-kinase [Lithohypha guttulata]|uniref:Inositol-pentakisphosphate 2-kinase n=1 Tax=Lithohypha guttulata TaxID=1690604 RepID=UPI00315DDEDA